MDLRTVSIPCIQFPDIEQYENNNVIVVGDWNSVLDPKIDTKLYTNLQKSKKAKEKAAFMRRKGLIDIWQVNHPLSQNSTWTRHNPTKLGRLDYFLISDTLFPLYADSYIEHSYRSDHSPIGLDIYIQKLPKGPGFGEINISLLLECH